MCDAIVSLVISPLYSTIRVRVRVRVRVRSPLYSTRLRVMLCTLTLNLTCSSFILSNNTIPTHAHLYMECTSVSTD